MWEFFTKSKNMLTSVEWFLKSIEGLKFQGNENLYKSKKHGENFRSQGRRFWWVKNVEGRERR